MGQEVSNWLLTKCNHPRFLAHLSTECSVRYCDHSPSVVVHPSVGPQFSCYHSSIYKYWPVSTKLGQNVYDHKISDELYNGTNRTRTVWVICPWIRKFAIFDFVNTLASANIGQSVPNLATIYMPIRFRMSSIMGQIDPEHPSYLPLNLEKLLNMTLFTLYHLQILTNQHQTWSKCMWS